MIKPYDYYRASEYVAVKISEVEKATTAVAADAADRGCEVYWRGQADHSWGLLSSLARVVSASADLDEELLQEVETRILSEATSWIKDLGDNAFAAPLSKLAYIQHHGIATRLLDFTPDPWTALFFAAEQLDTVDGRLFGVVVPRCDVIGSMPADLPWAPSGKYTSSTIQVFDPVAHGISFPRVANQQGVFVLGRLPSTQPYRAAQDSELGSTRTHALLAEEVRRILSIPVALTSLSPADNQRKHWVAPGVVPPYGVTIRVHVDKSSMRRDLARGQGRRISTGAQPLTHRYMYPDAAGMIAYSKILRSLSRGAGIP